VLTPADEPFLADIAENPDDSARRLIYADWLEDHGRALWAEFIRVRHELAGVLDDALKRSALVEQERDLLARIAEGTPLPEVLLKAPRVREVPGGPPLRGCLQTEKSEPRQTVPRQGPGRWRNHNSDTLPCSQPRASGNRAFRETMNR
jgi:uncharacterized protein (TIGR02996 family)